jgi:hypothetical protein
MAQPSLTRQLMGVLLVITGFVVSVVSLGYPSPAPLYGNIIGLVISASGAFIYFRSVGAIPTSTEYQAQPRTTTRTKSSSRSQSE